MSAAVVSPKVRILIVDDEPDNRELLGIILTSRGFQTQCVESGREALLAVAKDPPDLILLDVMMPEMNGFEVAAKIKSNHATMNIPVIMVTALDDAIARARAHSAGAAGLISKPIDCTELCQRVNNILQNKAFTT